jgi:hypothetical protein
MWMRPAIRDMLDSMEAAAPDAVAALFRTRNETLELLVALFRPAREGNEPSLREEIGFALDAVLAERDARRSRFVTLSLA